LATIRLAMLRDLLLALLVLALAALNFGHQSAVLAAGGRVIVTAQTSLCGDPLAPSGGEHFACHACRPDAVALPPSPVRVVPVCFAATAVAYAPVPPVAAGIELVGLAPARAPPAI
jgi:hypothetical protein